VDSVLPPEPPPAPQHSTVTLVTPVGTVQGDESTPLTRVTVVTD
jgi:hypothetical protein